MVVSYAPNLREWREKDGSSRESTGLRLEIPDHLVAVFKTLEKYGHFLRNKHKDGLRRHICFDDINMSLVMDFALPGEVVWNRAEYENAREEMRNAPFMGSFSIQPFSSSSTSDVTEGTPTSSATWSAPSNPAAAGGENDDQQHGREGWQEEEDPKMDQA